MTLAQPQEAIGEIAKHWIDGEWIDSETVSESINPAALFLSIAGRALLPNFRLW